MLTIKVPPDFSRVTIKVRYAHDKYFINLLFYRVAFIILSRSICLFVFEYFIQQDDFHEVDHNRCSSIAYKWKCQSCVWQDFEIDSNIDKCLNEYQREDSYSYDFFVIIFDMTNMTNEIVAYVHIQCKQKKIP